MTAKQLAEELKNAGFSVMHYEESVPFSYPYVDIDGSEKTVMQSSTEIELVQKNRFQIQIVDESFELFILSGHKNEFYAINEGKYKSIPDLVQAINSIRS